MLKETGVAIATLLVVSSVAVGIVPTDEGFAGTGTETNNEFPLADAGLDQEVTRGATVLLDGTGSRDPDGEIRDFRWSIRTPDDETVTPDCENCARTTFRPSEVGEYRVTLTVTDDDGAAESDTLYVSVSPGTEPSLSLAGPQQPTEGATATYTATLDAGTAALDYLVWTVDGTEIANQSLSATQASAEATKRFPTPDTRSVTATVYDVDGQSATETLSVSVQRDRVTKNPNPLPEPGPEIADRHDPTVIGDEVVTGTEPLRGQYEIQLDAAAEAVDSVEWRSVANRVGVGSSLHHTWEPGHHELYAVVTYTDGSENVATFSDGETTVTADPKPSVSLGPLDRWGSITGTPTVVDEYENLASLRVEIDGELVAKTGSTVPNRPRLDTERRRTLYFSHADFEPGRRYSVTVLATDKRGQKSTVTRDVVPVKEPEIVRSEFVNGPVDSYHERLDPSRYEARHVLEVDLNGVSPENISVVVKSNTEEVIPLGVENNSRERLDNDKGNSISIESYWSSDTSGDYEIRYNYQLVNNNVGWKMEGKEKFRVTPSKPELRLDVLNDGTKDYITKDHGILVDASDSFDPDGTELKYIWKYGAEPTKPDNATAKFDTYERAASVIEDQYDLRAERSVDFLSYYMPGVETTTTTTTGPYFPNDVVRVRVETNPFHFSKQSYYDDFSLGVSVSNPNAEVVEWRRIEASDTGHSDATEDAYRYVAIVEMPASKLSAVSGTPTVTVYNRENERKSERVNFPDVNVLLEDGTYWASATVRNLTYTVEKPSVREVTVSSQDERDAYLEDGYSIENREQRIEHVLEERVKVEDAKYGKRTKTLESKRVRNVFLGSQSDWYRAGTTTEEVTRTKTSTEWYSADTAESESRWHDGNLWNGEFTGRSREVVVEPAQYQTQKEYQYEYEAKRTGTRRVTRTRTVKVQRTGTRTITECTRKFGCHSTTITYTYYTTEKRTYTTLRTYTYTVTRTKTYWAASNINHQHETTGKTRRVKIKDAQHETQYEIERKEQYTDTVTRYVVARDELVQEARYEWREGHRTTDYLSAQQMASNENWRIGDSVTEAEWSLRKRTGTQRSVVSQYRNESHVVETSATVFGDRRKRYHNVETGETVTKTLERRSKQETFAGAKSRRGVLDEFLNPKPGENECKLKGTC